MPDVRLGPINQCTPDDPTDGADQPSAAPGGSNLVAQAQREPDSAYACEPSGSGAGGRGNDCTDALVRRFSSERGAPVIEDAGSDSCYQQAVGALQTCSSLLLSATLPKAYVATQTVSCVAAAGTLVECLTKSPDAAR
jgi:hypothetical protein